MKDSSHFSQDLKKSQNQVSDMKTRKTYERSVSAHRIEKNAKHVLQLQEKARNKFNRLIEEKVTKLKNTN